MAISAAGMKVVATVYQVDFDIEDGKTRNRVIDRFAERPLADMIPGKFSIWFWIRTDGTKRYHGPFQQSNYHFNQFQR